ncbi:MAG: Flp family type IVb pilin [Hyphomicrobiales bacterium]|nr:Flp family type IVb pilin [Hyphomicrobiales bacterium]
MKKLVLRFVTDESGNAAIEYGLIASLIGVAIILGATALGTNLNSALADLSAQTKGQ